MTKILIVDDEQKIREMIRKYAVHEGFETDEASDGMEAVEKCEMNHYDLVVMDIMMPNLDGFSAVKDIKKFDPDLPFIMLSALGEEYGERIQLSPKEYELLAYLSKNAGIALTREQLLRNVWGYDFFGDDRTLDTHIKLLRRNLGEYASYIVTLRGVGYRFEKEN